MSDFKEAALSLVNINKNFVQADKELSVIKNVTLVLRKSEISCLVGPSGSGKTTILQIAGLLDNATSGQVIIDAIDTSNTSDHQKTEIRKNKIGFIFQSHHLLPEFSAIENVAMPLLIRGKTKKHALELAAEALKEVELSDRLDFKPYQLSGGQQQRVAIARAIVGKPSLILADEPTGNLDSELAHKIFNLLLTLAKKHQISCLMVSHNQELADSCDRIIKIKDGAII